MWKIFFATSFLCLVSISSINAATIYMRPEADTFVVDPPANPPLAILAGEQDSDFGGAGSRAVASSSAFTTTNNAHGLFQSLLRFDGLATAGDAISDISLQLNVTQIMSGGMGVFNPSAQSGYVDFSMLTLAPSNEWVQGYGAPETAGQRGSPLYDPTQGTTYDILHNTILPKASVVDLKTLYFDATQLSTTATQTWVTFDLTCPALQNALSLGESFTLLLSPAAGDRTVNFNFQAYTQNDGPGVPPTIRSNGPQLLVTTAVSTSATWVGVTGNSSTQSWGLASNWSSNPAIPGGLAGDSVIFGSSSGTGSTTIDLNGNQTVGAIAFTCTGGSTGYAYILSQGTGGGTLISNNGSSGTASITVSAGQQQVAAPLELVSDTQFNTTTASSVLDVAGDIRGSGALEKLGPGTLILSGTDTYLGGTIVNAGTLIVASNAALPVGTSLTIGAGGMLLFDPSQVATAQLTSSATLEINPVPEPGTLTLLATAVCGAAVFQRSRSRRKKP